MATKEHGKLINEHIHQQLREKISFLNHDVDGKSRVFFENAGGSLRLTSSILKKNEIDLLPDCPERQHKRALTLQTVMEKAHHDIFHTMFNAQSGSLITELTASQVMFQIVAAIVQNVPGTNVITTNIEHPSSYDAIKLYCQKTNKEMRVARVNSEGFVTPEAIVELMDEGTILVSVIAASNISGNIMDLAQIVNKARQKKPGVFIISDAVQHLPHGTIDVQEILLDGINFAPYKFLGTRGIGIGYVSERVSALPHHKIIGRPDSVWSLGSPAPSVFKSISEVIDYVCWLGRETATNTKTERESFLAGMEAIVLHERALLARLLNGSSTMPGLRDLKKVKVFIDSAPLSKRDLIVAMGIDGWEFSELRVEYQKRGVTVFERVNTSLFSKRIVESLGLTGVIRVSPLHCHTITDIDKFLKITEDIASMQK